MWGLLLPKVRRQFAEFLQYTSLKRLGILYLPTCVGLGYGLPIKGRWGYFLEPLRSQTNPLRTDNLRDPSHTTRYRNINLFPIDYPLRARLRGRLTLRGLALRRNPWDFGDRASHPVYRYSCLHSHFRYLHARLPLRFTGLRNAPLPRALLHTLSFGACLEPRYIFAAKPLI
jgi:hypothetical protein